MHLIFDILWFLLITIYSYIEALVKCFIPVKRKSVTGEIVLITGAAHGIGRLTAFEFAKHGSGLVLWDINKHGIEGTAEECRRLGAKAYPYLVDCSSNEEVYSAAEKVRKDVGDVTILVNNAGVIATGDVLSIQDKQIQKMFDVNILAHYWTIKAFLPAMMKNNHGHIVSIASAGGFVPVPFLVPYCSSKFAAVGFHKGFTKELHALGKDGIKTTCFCPTFVNTGFIKNPQMRLMPILKPDEVASKLMDGILCNQKMIFIPSSIKMSPLLSLILPERALVAFDKLMEVKFDINKKE
ncbi:estradiol 17-beta-dehydrogenase 11 [Liasis olivaceus]